MKIEEIMSKHSYKPIRNCPGRYILVIDEKKSIEEIINLNIEIKEYNLRAAKDIVLIVKLDNGGLISYKRNDGTFLHTINTNEGFERKIKQLGISLLQTE